MSKKRKYRSIHISKLEVPHLVEKIESRKVVVPIDIAKTEMYASIMDERQQVHKIVKWQHPVESRSFIEILLAFRSGGFEVEVAMEPSGTYGDALRAKVLEQDIPVYRVNPKRSHDAAEVYDGVPSLHDAKSAGIIGKLHLDGASEAWPIRSTSERELSSALRVLKVHEQEARRNRNRLEGLLARHWPELPRILDLDSATLMELLIEFGGPSGVAEKEAKARNLMRRVGGHFLCAEKIDAVIECAMSSFGLHMIEEEQRTLQVIAAEGRRAQKESNKAKRRVEKLTKGSASAREMSDVVGKTTAAVLVAAVGDPRNYESPSSYEKSIGLNLKEFSSGKKKGGLHITKRGPGITRLFLFMAVLRLIQDDAVIRAWYSKKVRRQGGKMKTKAIVAIMRKLVKALWYVARGNKFDSSLLFDTSRLALGR